jgi:hypothetical protein
MQRFADVLSQVAKRVSDVPEEVEQSRYFSRHILGRFL